MRISGGKVHEYLGMTLDYSVDGEVEIRMDDYIKKMVADFSEALDDKANTPAA